MNTDIVLVVGCINCNDRTNSALVAWTLGKPARSAEQFGGPGLDIAAAGVIDRSAWVESRFLVALWDTTVDAVNDRVAALAAQLRDLASITVGLKGSVYTGTIIPKVAECIEIPLEAPWDSRLMNAHKTQVELVILREPWVYSALDALYTDESLAVPAVLDLSAITGNAAAPLDLLLTADSADLHQVIAGVYPDESAVITKFIREAHVLSWSGGAAGTMGAGWPNGSGNTVWKTNSLTGVHAHVDVTDFEPGSYMVFANATRDSSCAPATVWTLYTAPVNISSTALRREYVGTISLPCDVVHGSGASTLELSFAGDGTDYAYLNTIEFIPASWGLVGWHGAAAGDHAHALRFADGLVYADDIASLGSRVKDAGLIGWQGTLVITGEAVASAPTLAVSLDASYIPRWEQFPCSGTVGPGPGI